jgi:hypothetical protein
MQAAQQGNKQAQQLAQMIQAVAQQLQGGGQQQPTGTPSARRGAKLQYINSLRNVCGADEQVEYYKAGGKTCHRCIKAQKAREGDKIKDPVTAFKCGRKIKKNAYGGDFQKKNKDLIPKGQEGLEVAQRMIPVWGTLKEAKQLYDYPSWEQAGWTALSALGDASMFVLPLVGGPIKAAATAAKAANVASKAAKVSKVARVAKVAKSAKTAAKAAGAKVAEDVTTPALYGVLARPTIGTAGRFGLASNENNLNTFGMTKEQADSLYREELRRRYPIEPNK